MTKEKLKRNRILEATFEWDTEQRRCIVGVLNGRLSVWFWSSLTDAELERLIPAEQAKDVVKVKYKGLNIYFQHRGNIISVIVVNKSKAREFEYEDGVWYEWRGVNWCKLETIPEDLKEIFSVVML